MPIQSASIIKYVIIPALALLIMPGCSSRDTNAGSPVYYQSEAKQSPRSPVTFVTDTVLMARIKSKFRSDDMVDDQDIHVSVHHGVAYLDGWTTDIYQRRLAQDLVKSIDGVSRVVSRLKIADPGTVFVKPGTK